MTIFEITHAGHSAVGHELVNVDVNGDRSIFEHPRQPAEDWIAKRCEGGDTVKSPERTETGAEYHQRRSRSTT